MPIICSDVKQKIPLLKLHGKLTDLHEKAVFRSAWRVSWYWACNGMQTYVIAFEKCDLMVFVPSKSNDKHLLYIAPEDGVFTTKNNGQG